MTSPRLRLTGSPLSLRRAFCRGILRQNNGQRRTHCQADQHARLDHMRGGVDSKDHRHHHNPGLIDVQELATSMRDEVRSYVQSCSTPPKLVGILADRSHYYSLVSPPPIRARVSTDSHHDANNFDDDAEVYSNNIAETLNQDGIEYELQRCQAMVPKDVEKVIRAMNQRDDVHGILIFYPIFKTANNSNSLLLKSKGPYLDASTGVYYKTPDDYLRDTVCPTKDVEALSNQYKARWLFRARKQIVAEPYVPCTVQAVLKILQTYHYHRRVVNSKGTGVDDSSLLWAGLTATIVNRSEILGRPLAALMALQGANVYSVDESSILQFMPGGRMRRCRTSLRDCLQQSTVVVTAVPSAEFCLPSDCIQEGTTVVNVAVSMNVDEESLLKRPNVKLVPQVGSCTVAALEHNLIRLHQQQFT